MLSSSISLSPREKEIPCMSHTVLPFKYSFPCTNKCHILILLSHSPPSPSHTKHLSQFPPFSSVCLMIPELEKPRVTEIQVRMDCNGCVQKIKKALHGINGIYDLYIDFPQQKLTIIGWADPERIVKAIRKTRKIATICSHTEAEPNNQPAEKPAESSGGPPPDAANPPPPEGPPAEVAQPAEPPKDPPPPENPAPPENPPPLENPPPEVKPSPIAAETNGNQQAGPSGSRDIGEVHVIYHHPPDYGYRYGYGHSYSGQRNRYSNGHGYQHEAPQGPQPIYHEAPQGPQPVYVTHGYNAYKPSPYVTEYEYVRSPPRYTHYSRMDHSSEDYHNNNGYHHNNNNNNNGNITSIFSDENPNACRIM